MRKIYKSDILLNKKDLSLLSFPCVYFLIQDNQIVYIGYSNTFYLRISQHLVSEKVFDSYYFIKYDSKEEALLKEKEFIKEFNPFFNGQYSDKSNDNFNGVIKAKTKEPKMANIFKKAKVFIDGELLTTEGNTIEKAENTLFVTKINFKIPNNSYIKKNDNRYYFNIKNVIYTSNKETFILNSVVYTPIGIFGSIYDISEPIKN
jgi:hypothetical protein